MSIISLTKDWDPEKILTDYGVTISWDATQCGWSFKWKHGTWFIGNTSETIAHKGAALFVLRWSFGVEASLCGTLMADYINYLEAMEGTTI